MLVKNKILSIKKSKTMVSFNKNIWFLLNKSQSYFNNIILSLFTDVYKVLFNDCILLNKDVRYNLSSFFFIILLFL